MNCAPWVLGHDHELVLYYITIHLLKQLINNYQRKVCDL